MVIRMILTLLMGVTFLSQTSRAELVIEVTEGLQSAIPIAVVPFKIQSSAGQEVLDLDEDISAIVRNDLNSSGYFNSLDPSLMISQPSSVDQVLYTDWKRLRQDFIVIGRVLPEIGGFAVEFNVLDSHSRVEMLRHRVRGKKSQLRDIAHYISDYIFQRLTGIPGVFSTKLVYVTTNRQRTQFNLNYADADGARERLIFRSKQSIISPAWSADGKTIAYVSFENGRSEIFFQELATGERKKVVSGAGSSSAPSFSPDGQYLAFVQSSNGNPDIYMRHLKTGEQRRLTQHYGIDTEPQWLPDSRNLLFTSSRAGGPQIYQLDTVTGKVKRLTFEGGYNARPRITADGRKMIFVHRLNDSFHIASFDMKTSSVRVLTKDTKLDESPSVAPNGSMVVYAASEMKRRILAAVSVDGEVKFRLPSRFGDVREPAWSPILR